MIAEPAKQRIVQASLGALDVAAMAQAHELHVVIDPGRLTDFRDLMPEVVRLPRQMHLTASVELVARDDQRSLPKVEAVFTFAAVAYNLVRLPKLLAGGAA